MSNEIKNSENIKSCIILCGGQSRRMGQDKGSMIIQDKPMIKHILSTLNHHIDEAIIVLNDKSRVDRYSEFINSNDYSYQTNRLKTSEPIHSIYKKEIIDDIEKLVNDDILHIKGLIEKIDTKFVLIDNKKIEKKEFRNLNRPEDI